jgi:hypothetical protein
MKILVFYLVCVLSGVFCAYFKINWKQQIISDLSLLACLAVWVWAFNVQISFK